MLRSFICLLITFIGSLAHAQLDSTSAVLFRSGGGEISPEELDSSRYKVRAPVSQKEDEITDEKPGTYIPSPVPARPRKATADIAGPAKDEKPVPTPAATAPSQPSGASPAAAIAPMPAAAPTGTPPAVNGSLANQAVAQQVRELILGGSSDDIEEYRRQVHSQDPRANFLSIFFAPSFFYSDSSSAYSFNRYTTGGPGFGAGMNLWLTPFFGVQARYFSSVTASVRNGAANTVPIDVQNFQAGLRFRKHFGYSRKAASLTYGLDYHDSGNKISREAETLVGRRSSGLNLAMEAEVPTSITYAHTFEVGIQPRLHHSQPATMAEARSGTKYETNAVSLSIGGQWVLDRRNQVFWKTQYNIERTLYQGEASEADPHTDLTPDGVSVTNSQAMFYFGFRWGS